MARMSASAIQTTLKIAGFIERAPPKTPEPSPNHARGIAATTNQAAHRSIGAAEPAVAEKRGSGTGAEGSLGMSRPSCQPNGLDPGSPTANRISVSV